MLGEFEKALGTGIVERADNRFQLTAAGVVLAPRLAYIATLAGDVAEAPVRADSHQGDGHLMFRFLFALTESRCNQLLVLQETRSIGSASLALQISADAVRKVLRDSEARLSFPLFERREGGRLVTTARGQTMLSRARVLRREVAHAAADVSALRGSTRGVLAVGCLPSVAASLVPAAVNTLLAEHPLIEVRLAEGTYDELLLNLQSGHLDLIAGGINPAASISGLLLDALYVDRLRVFARSSHPLASRKKLSRSDLSGFRWVVPTRGPITEPVLEALLAKAGIYPKAPRIECASVAAVSGLLLSGDLLAAAAASQFRSEVGGGQLTELPFDLPSEPWVCGLIRRNSAPPSVAMTLFRNVLREGPWKEPGDRGPEVGFDYLD